MPALSTDCLRWRSEAASPGQTYRMWEGGGYGNDDDRKGTPKQADPNLNGSPMATTMRNRGRRR
eukprot:2249184-Pyramimonas_sp.AAC.1